MIGVTLLARGAATGAGAALVWLAYRTRARHEKPAARSFSALLAVLGLTALCAGATAHAGTPYKLVWLYTGLAIPLALAFFAFDYYGLDLLATRARARTAVAPAVAGAVGGTVAVLAAGAPPAAGGAAVLPPGTLPGAVLDAAVSLDRIGRYYTTAVMVLAVGLVLRTVRRYDHLDARLGPVVSFVGVWPWLANLLVPDLAAAFGPGVGIAAVAGGYTTSVLVAALAVGPFGLFASSPMAGTVGPETVLDSMEDPVVVVDDHARVLRVNAAAREAFGTTAAAAVGGPVADLIDRPLDALGPDGDPVALPTADGVRQFAVTQSAVADRTGAERGRALVLRDVTRRRTREQRLDVFNRILRHNLRNDANAILGNAQLVADGGDPEDCADRIADTTRDLVGVAARAREVDRILSAPADGGPTPVGPVVDAVVAEVTAEHPAVEVTVAVPDGATAAVSRPVLAVVLRNLVRNAAEHNDAAEPIVVVSADRAAGGSLSVAVADNGPGIPEHERAVLDAGEEGQLRHGSGLGLWAVHWGVTRMGGTLSFGGNEPRGSVVTVTLPAAGTPDVGRDGTAAADGDRSATAE